MSDLAEAAPSGPLARQAASLLLLASRVLGAVPAPEAQEGASAVRSFADEPTSARYLSAVRVLRRAERRHKLNALGRAVGPRRTEQGLDALSRGAALAPELSQALRALPGDALNRRRLTLIAEMLTAHRLIEARASGALRELQRALGPLPRATTSQRRARPARRS